MSSVGRFFLISFSLMAATFYLPAIIFYPFIGEYLNSYYTFDGAPHIYVFVMYTLYIFFLFFFSYVLDKTPRIRLLKLPRSLSMGLVTIVIILFLISCIYFFIYHNSAFRHASRLKDASVFVTLMFLLRPIINFYIVFSLLYVINGKSIGKNNKLLLWAVFIGFVLSINSSLHIVSIVLLFFLLVTPSIYKIKFSIRFIFISMLLCPVLVYMVLVVGVGNKIGYASVLSTSGLEYLTQHVGLYMARVSSSTYSIATVGESFLNSTFNFDQGIYAIKSTFSNRYNSIFHPGSFDFEMIETINRYNYLVVFENHAPRAGASPGVLASMLYFPYFPAGLMMVPLFHALVTRSLSFHIKGDVNAGAISYLAIPFFLIMFFESPLDILYVIDPFFISVFVLFLFNFVSMEKVLSK